MKVKSNLFLLICFVSFLFFSGCETTRGAVEGTARTVVGTAEGAAKDTMGVYAVIKAIDDWIRENMW